MIGGGELFQPRTAAPITHDSVLVTEGRDAYEFFSALVQHLGLRQLIEVRNGGGLPGLHDYFADLVLISGFSSVQSLGIVRDNESDPTGAFQAVCSGLQRASLPVPLAPLQPTPTPPLPRVSLLLLPTTGQTGMLETLCWQALANHPLSPCVEEYLNCVRKQTGKPLSREDKSRIHAYIAGREKPALRLGEASHAGYFPWGDSVFDEAKQFLNGLIASTP